MAQSLPEGFAVVPEFLTPAEELDLLQFIRALEFRTFEMHGVTARRRIVQFGFHYSFQSYRLTEAAPIPAEFASIRARSAELAGIAPDEFAEALVTEYRPGAGIGWHRDAPSFGIVAGISLAGPCRMRFQRGKGSERETAAIHLPPRSCYLLAGEARSTWEHSIPPTRNERYSITFRTLKRGSDARGRRPDGPAFQSKLPSSVSRCVPLTPKSGQQ
jgi:alkylated DNA repair dioxygenase AlkB